MIIIWGVISGSDQNGSAATINVVKVGVEFKLYQALILILEILQFLLERLKYQAL